MEHTQGVLAVLAVLFASAYIFRDTTKGVIELMKFLYNNARTSLGYSSFAEEELSDTEKTRNIRKFRNAHVGGLYNEGNTCFMNSVIQALASSMPVVEFVDSHKDDLNFSGSLHDTILNLNQIHTRRHGYSTLKLVSQIDGAQRWSRYNQEDAQEFFQQLLNSLEKDTKATEKSDPEADSSSSSSSSPESVASTPGSPVPVADSGADSPSVNEKSGDAPAAPKLVTPFDGLFGVRVGCLQCGYMEGIRTGVLSSVDLSLDGNYTNVTLHELLQNYTEMETISGVECYKCSLLRLREELEEKVGSSVPQISAAFQQRIDEVDRVLQEKVIDDKVYSKLQFASLKVQTDKTKQTMFARPNPKTLMIHINRSVFDLRLGLTRKNPASVDFPVVLDLSPYTCDPEDKANFDPSTPMRGLPRLTDDLYDLKAAVIHYGSANFGHYICFRKYHGLWWRISDDQVDLTTEAQVLKAQGVFMLFYEKRGAAATTEYPLEPVLSTGSAVGETEDRKDENEGGNAGGASSEEISDIGDSGDEK